MPSAPAAFRVALLFLPAAACAVEGAGPEGLDEIQAVRPFEVDAGAIRPANCGSQEVLEVDLTNTSAASISAWAVFSTEYRIGTEEGAANPSETAVEPVVLAPGESTTFSIGRIGYDEEADLFIDVLGARVLASNMDPSDPAPPEVALAARDRCEPRDEGSPSAFAVPIALDPGGVSHARQALADITPALCPFREQSGAVLENRRLTEVTVWAGWTVDPASLDEWERDLYGDDLTVFAAPIRLPPGARSQLAINMPSGYDVTEVVVMTNDPEDDAGDAASDLILGWHDTCVP